MAAIRDWVADGARKLSGVACLLACLLGQTEALPDMLAFCAWLEGTHSIHMARNVGKLNLVLSHEQGIVAGMPLPQPGPSAPAVHQHGLASKALCLLARRSSTQRDHEISFQGGSLCESIRVQDDGGEALLKTVPRPALLALSSHTPFHSSSLLTDEGHALPGTLTVLRSLRSTSLLL